MIPIRMNAIKVKNPNTGEYEGLAGLGGAPGEKGESMYQTAVRNGFTGTESDFLKEFAPDNVVAAIQTLKNQVDQILDGSAGVGGGTTVVTSGGLIIQEDEPEGNPNKTWIKPSTRIQHYFGDGKWIPLSAVWGGTGLTDDGTDDNESGGDDSNVDSEAV